MGRHGAGQTSRRRSRVSFPVAAIIVLVLAAVGFSFWLYSVRSVVDPIDAGPVDAYAVVISSPSCTSGSGSTVIDLTLTPTVRSSLSACGRRVGERLAVQYLSGHPDQVRLAGTTVAHSSSARRWLPIAIVAAGLLAVVGTVALLIERRQSRHAGTAARVSVAQLRAAAAAEPVGVTPTPTPSAVAHPTSGSPAGTRAGSDAGSPGGSPGGSNTGAPELPAGALPVAGGALGTDSGDGAIDVDSRPGTGSTGSTDGTGGIDATDGTVSPDVTSRIAVGFAGPGINAFRPSEISVEDDLFTHRGTESPDR